MHIAGSDAYGTREPVRRFMIKTDGRIVFVKAEEVDWIEANDYYARLRVGKTAHLMRDSLSSLEQQLDPQQFVRIHRSALVNIDRVTELRLQFKGDCTAVLSDGTELRVGRSRRAGLEARLLRRR